MNPVTIDFETYGIEPRPEYPPVPVGVSIKYPGQESKYYAFGHPDGNNCSMSEARIELMKAFSHPGGLLFHNAKFDLAVAEKFFGLKPETWDQVHDTLFLLFLDDPNQKELGLKPSAERLLGMRPEERDAVCEYLVKNQPVAGVRISSAKSSKNYFGRYICMAPGDLVGKYAVGDTDRTKALFDLLYPRIQERGMQEAYDRERKLMMILLEVEEQGVPVDLEQLDCDVNLYNLALKKIDQWVHAKLGQEINIDSGSQLMSAMVAKGLVDTGQAPRTATGKLSTSKGSLLACVKDPVLLAVLQYRSQLNTCMHTFMEPWLATARRSCGLIFTTWNQVRSPTTAGFVGTRTGRLSSTPNFQNIPKEFPPLFAHEAAGLPEAPFELPPLPNVRRYIAPHRGHVLIDRDYSQQEPRILAHFDGGDLMCAYNDNPWVDFHDYAKDELERVGLHYARKQVKITNLGIIYGMGLGVLAERLELPVDEAKKLKKAVMALYPGLSAMYADMKYRSRHNLPIRTWGGREYYCEEPKVVNGRPMTFDYKMVNTLIQGSAADCTKEALIRYYKAKHPDARLLLNVHDQIVVSVPEKLMKSEMEVLRLAMEGVEFDVPMLSEGKVCLYNWGEGFDYDKKGVTVWNR